VFRGAVGHKRDSDPEAVAVEEGEGVGRVRQQLRGDVPRVHGPAPQAQRVPGTGGDRRDFLNDSPRGGPNGCWLEPGLA